MTVHRLPIKPATPAKRDGQHTAGRISDGLYRLLKRQAWEDHDQRKDEQRQASSGLRARNPQERR